MIPSSEAIVFPQTAMHDEAAQRISAKLHPLAGLNTHDADRPALRGQRRHLRVRARLLLDAPALRRHHEQGIYTYIFLPNSLRSTKPPFLSSP